MIERPTGDDGQLETWTQRSLNLEGLILTCFEPDPEAEVSADLSTWLAPGWDDVAAETSAL
jgi:hypothetical protein